MSNINPSFADADVNTDFTDIDMMQVIGDHLTTLINSANTKTISVNPMATYRYANNLYAFLNSLGSAKPNENLYFLIARMNGMLNSSDFNEKIKFLRLPDYNEVNSLLLLENSKHVN